jgi:hypothetical protein
MYKRSQETIYCQPARCLTVWDNPDIGDALAWGSHAGVPPGVHDDFTAKEMTLGFRSHLVRAAAIGALGVVTVVGFVAPASAATTGGVHATAAGVHVAAKGPNTDITGSPAKWDPTKLTVKPVTSAKCSTTNYSFSVSNVTTKTQAVQEKTSTGKKKTLFTLKSKTAEAVCATGPKGASGDLYIKGSKSVLTVTLS